MALWVCRGRNWDNFPDLRVIWDSDDPPNPYVLGCQPHHITEENTEYELDPLGTVESQVSISYEEGPDLRSFLFRATLREGAPAWYFIQARLIWP